MAKFDPQLGASTEMSEYLRAKYVDEFYFPLNARNNNSLCENIDTNGQNEFASEIQKLVSCKCDQF